MITALKSVVSPDILADNMLTIHQFLRESYHHTRQHLHEGVSFFKEEFTDIRIKAGQYVNRMMLPVNNFLKDISQIEHELQSELNNEPDRFVLMEGRMALVDEILTRPMEENY